MTTFHLSRGGKGEGEITKQAAKRGNIQVYTDELE
jgi:hypothetical protein